MSARDILGIMAIGAMIFIIGMVFQGETNMAKTEVKTITVNYGVTENLGNYESLRLDYGMSVTVDDSESAIDKLHAVRTVLRREVKKAVLEERQARTK